MAAPFSSRLSDLTSQERDLRAQIRTAQRASNRKGKRREMCGFTCIELRFALRLYVLDGFDTKTSVVYFKQQLEQRYHVGMESYCVDELSVMVENAYLDLTDSDAAALVGSSCPEDQKNILKAQNFLAERRLRDWIVMQNVVKGLAPLSSFVGLRWDCMHETSTENPFGVIRGDMLHSKNRKWIGRFRHRWGLRLGKIPARDFMSIDDIHPKASSMDVFFRHPIAKQRFFQPSSNNVFICGA